MIVHLEGVDRVAVAAWAGMDADILAFFRREAL